MRKMKFLKKVTAVALALGMLTIPNLSLAATGVPNADTAGIEVQPRWTYLRFCSCGLEVIDGPNKIIGGIFSTDTYHNGAGVEAELEWYNPESGWEEMSDEFKWSGYTTQNTYYDISKTHIKVPNYGKYRALVTFFAVDSNGERLEASSDYTNIVTVSQSNS